MVMRYHTSLATFIQLAVMTLMVIVGGIIDVAKNCENSNECVTNSFLWIIIAFMLALWYFGLFGLGYLAQEKRSRRLTKLLIAAESFTAFVALMFLKNPSSVYSGIGAAVALFFALWIIFLAYRIHKAKGGRITTTKHSGSTRPRRRLSEK